MRQRYPTYNKGDRVHVKLVTRPDYWPGNGRMDKFLNAVAVVDEDCELFIKVRDNVSCFGWYIKKSDIEPALACDEFEELDELNEHDFNELFEVGGD